MDLYETSLDGKHIVKPDFGIPDPSEAELKYAPGAVEALKGLQSLDFRVCSTSGTTVRVRPDKLAIFSQMPAEVRNDLDVLLRQHNDVYSTAVLEADGEADDDMPLATLDPASSAPGVCGSPADPEGTDDSETLEVLDSIEALRARVSHLEECKCTVSKGVAFFRDAKGKTVYMVSKTDDVVIKASEYIGGIGGGAIVDADDDCHRAVTWALPKGDQTVVQMASSKSPKDDEDVVKQPKFTTGTLYSVLRDLERKSTKSIRMSSFGQVSTVTVCGRHMYKFATPTGESGHRRIDYQLNFKDGKVSATNVFGPLVDKDGGVGKGPLGVVWRLMFEPVSHVLKPQRPHVIAATRFELKKGKPVKVAWRA